MMRDHGTHVRDVIHGYLASCQIPGTGEDDGRNSKDAHVRRAAGIHSPHKAKHDDGHRGAHDQSHPGTGLAPADVIPLLDGEVHKDEHDDGRRRTDADMQAAKASRRAAVDPFVQQYLTDSRPVVRWNGA